MKKTLGFVGYFVGFFIGVFIGNAIVITICSIICCIVGILLGASVDEEEEGQKRVKEKEEENERLKRQAEQLKKSIDILAERKKTERKHLEEERINKAILLVRKYPEAAKYYLKQDCGYTKLWIYDWDITYNVAVKLLSHSEFEYSLKEENIKSARREPERKVAEQKRLEAERWEEQKRLQEEQEREERERQERYKNTLLEKVSGWDTLGGGLKYFSMYYYYPTTCEFDVEDEDWDIRWLIWNFKASPKDGNVNYSKKEVANEKVRGKLSKCLCNCFSSEILSNITFVCIPASSSASTERRYRDFSESICNELGMRNAYPYVRVSRDGESKNKGGTQKAEYSFDGGFFKGKYVILFDDVITKGDSMIRFKRKMEQMGAVVICGISIGKTTHTPHDIHPIDMI